MVGLGPSPSMAHLVGGTQPNPPPGPISQREKSPQGHYAAWWVVLPIPEMEGKEKRVSQRKPSSGDRTPTSLAWGPRNIHWKEITAFQTPINAPATPRTTSTSTHDPRDL